MDKRKRYIAIERIAEECAREIFHGKIKHADRYGENGEAELMTVELLRKAFSQIKKMAANDVLGEALNSGEGVYKP